LAEAMQLDFLQLICQTLLAERSHHATLVSSKVAGALAHQNQEVARQMPVSHQKPGHFTKSELNQRREQKCQCLRATLTFQNQGEFNLFCVYRVWQSLAWRN
jgi:hypothetical protein